MRTVGIWEAAEIGLGTHYSYDRWSGEGVWGGVAEMAAEMAAGALCQLWSTGALTLM